MGLELKYKQDIHFCFTHTQYPSLEIMLFNTFTAPVF